MPAESFVPLPEPREIRRGAGTATLDFRGSVEIPPGLDPRFARAVERWADAVEEITGSRPSVAARAEGVEPAMLRIRIQPGGYPEQGYTLELRQSGAELEAGDEAGLYYGLQTLLQILRQTTPKLPELTVRDAPDFAHRGYMLDVSRCKVPRMDGLFHLVDRLAEWKFNQLQLYMEHTFAFAGHETVWKDASPFTGGEIEELDAYCRDRYIDLVPNLNSFGHLERWLRHPEYHHLAESPGGFVDPWGKHRPFGSTLKPNQESLAFLDSLYSEFLPHFSIRTFNIGCDETWELGQGWSRPLVEEKGAARVYLDFLLKIHGLVEKHGRRAQFWGDIVLKHPECVAELPRSLTGMIWGYEADHPYEANCRTFREAGVPFYVVPGTSAWKSLVGRVDNCLTTLRSAAENGLRFGGEGLLVTDWGDAGHHQFFPIGLPGIAYGAAVAWCLERNRDLSLASALDVHVFGSDSAGLGEILLEMGTAYRDAGKLTWQSTLFHHLLFTRGEELGEVLSGVSGDVLRDVLGKLDTIAGKTGSTAPRCPDGDLIVREIVLNVRMARHAVRRGLEHLASGAAGSRDLREDLAGIVDEFESLWLERARSGGLAESAGYLREVLEEYGKR